MIPVMRTKGLLDALKRQALISNQVLSLLLNL